MRYSEFVLTFSLLCCVAQNLDAQNHRDELIRRDRELWSQVETWHYDDLDAARDRAAAANKPLMVVLRCVP